MSRVYKNCDINIAADPPTLHEASIYQAWSFQDRCYIAMHQRLLIRKDLQDSYLLSLGKNLGITEYAARSLQRRAWVFQERLLSPRTLHFSEQLFWECREKLASETFPTEIDFDHGGRDVKERALYVQPHNNSNYNVWHELLHSYLRCDLTFPKDPLAAMGAIAEYFAGLLQVNYCAGLW
jgi:hypothetical protein